MIIFSELKNLELPNDVLVTIESLEYVNNKDLEVTTVVKKCYDYEHEIPDDYKYQRRTEIKNRFGGTCNLIEYFCVVIGKNVKSKFHQISFIDFVNNRY